MNRGFSIEDKSSAPLPGMLMERQGKQQILNICVMYRPQKRDKARNKSS
jgi:hypothetical protein